MTESFAHGLVGITLDDRYRLDAVLGEGGMGAVFRATHLAMERKVAVKLLKPHLTSDATQLERFAREARSTLKVDSPHAVKVLDFGVTPHRDYYMVLEYLDGRTVQRELDVDGPFTPKRGVHVARQALHAIGAAHRRGLVHRDIKPDNVLLMRVGTDPDYTKMLDFGVAKLMQGAAADDPSQLALTQVGMVFGTPEFMSPEQACGHPLDGRSDLYSLAATLFVMLTGHGLFEARSAIEWLMHHAKTPPPNLAMVRPELAAYPELDELLQRCLAKHRDHRPHSADELESLLAALAPTLDRTPGAPPTSNTMARTQLPPPAFSASSYFHALAAETLSRAPDDRDVSAGGSVAILRPARETTKTPPLTGTVPAIFGRRRGLLIVIGAIAVVGTIGTAVGIAMSRGSRSTSPTASISDARVVTPPDAAIAQAPTDATIVEVMADATAAVIAVDAGPRPPVIRKSPADEHVRQAEQALRSGNLLLQLSQADLALRRDARHPRAKFLLGDALIRSGDTTRGCAYLRSINRKHSACPTD
ncbi:MAG: protein kinase [Deltaproteobacteria bacterium]|nr:protein kinase [Deltaproteobacteria bacterium]MDQ3299480.1 protein kinase [Myxococcota bacterium]